MGFILYGTTIERARAVAVHERSRVFLVLGSTVVAFALVSASLLLPDVVLGGILTEEALRRLAHQVKTLQQLYIAVSLLAAFCIAAACIAGTSPASSRRTRYRRIGTAAMILYVLFTISVLARYDAYLALKHTLSVGG